MGEPEKAAPPERFSAYIVIPAPIYFHPELSSRAKMLYGLLSCMSNERGYAYPRNETLQRYMGGVSEDTVGRTLRELEKAGAIFTENGAGGSPKNIRKIYLGELYPASLRKNADPSLRKNADPNNNSKNNKKQNKAASDAEVNGWISAWGAGLGYSMELVTPLIADFFGYAENRKAKKKPFLTARSVAMQGKRLVISTQGIQDATERVARMRYMLQNAISHNWDKVYPIGEKNEDDFAAWAAQEYGIQPPGKTTDPEYF